MYSSSIGADTTGRRRLDCQAETSCDGGPEKSNAEMMTFVSRIARITGDGLGVPLPMRWRDPSLSAQSQDL